MIESSISQHGDRYEFDAIILGSGIAGLSYALNLLEICPRARIAFVTKKSLDESNSRYAQGGISSVYSAEDSLEKHIRDTLRAGDGLCHEAAVREMLTAAPECLAELIKRGVIFDRAENCKDFELGLEGGHSDRRIFRSGDQTGAEIIRALGLRIRDNPNIEVFENHTGVNLITQVEKHVPGSLREVIGVYVLEEGKEVIHTFLGRVVVLATGGAGKIYRYTTNPEVATGDGIAMAYRAGGRVGNLEFYQFHPTLLFHREVNNFLISESLRGEGAYLRLPHSEERFMKRYEPKEMELATRDKVARAIFGEIERGGLDHVLLDIRHKDKDFLIKRFPKIYLTLKALGIDLAKDMVPVVPAAHYLCGGILSSVSGQTDLKRLYALGETAFTGLHGANRLASNSLTEGLVMAKHCALETAPLLEMPVSAQRSIRDWDSQSVTDFRRHSQINAHWRGLRGEMTSYGGIVRTEEGLRDLLKLISARRQMIEDYYWSHLVTRDLIELRNIVLLSELITRSALNRRESRGVHFREDYPKQISQPEDTILRFSEIFPISTNPFERPAE